MSNVHTQNCLYCTSAYWATVSFRSVIFWSCKFSHAPYIVQNCTGILYCYIGFRDSAHPTQLISNNKPATDGHIDFNLADIQCTVPLRR